METTTNVIEQINAFIKNDLCGDNISGYDIRDIPEFEDVVVKGIENGETEFELIHDHMEEYGEWTESNPEWIDFLDTKMADGTVCTMEVAMDLKWHLSYDKEANLLNADVQLVDKIGDYNRSRSSDEVIIIGGQWQYLDEYVEEKVKRERDMTDEQFAEFRESDEYWEYYFGITDNAPKFEDFDFSSIRASKAFEFYGKF